MTGKLTPRQMTIVLPAYIAACFAIFYLFAQILPVAMEREERRREVVREYNCQHYGRSMNEWAAVRNRELPCPNQI